MNRSVVLIQKPVGYVSPKSTRMPSLFELMAGEEAQGGIIGFYITIMIAAILVLNVVWPTIDSLINGGSASYTNLSATAKTIVGLFGLVLMLGLLVMILKPVM